MPLNKNVTNDKLYLTDCLFCPKGVYKKQPKVWICDIVVGYVHKACNEKYGDTPLESYLRRKYVPSGV